MWLKIERDLLLLAFVRQDRADKKHETIGRDTIVQLETLLSGRNGGEHGETIDPGFDVGGRSVLLRQHGRDTGNLILQPKVSDRMGILAQFMHLGRDDKRDHGSTRSALCDQWGVVRGQ